MCTTAGAIYRGNAVSCLKFINTLHMMSHLYLRRFYIKSAYIPCTQMYAHPTTTHAHYMQTARTQNTHTTTLLEYLLYTETNHK